LSGDVKRPIPSGVRDSSRRRDLLRTITVGHTDAQHQVLAFMGILACIESSAAHPRGAR
jgi:hypothetical protein